MKKNYHLSSGLLVFILGMAYIDVSYAQEQICSSSVDCKSGYYCATFDSSCGGNGVCVLKPDACLEIYAPVCGCDGITYGNKCEAASAGVNATSEGPCIQPVCGECTSDADCAAGTACNASDICLPSCECQACDVCAGNCVQVPLVCKSNADCTNRDFCQKPVGDCTGEGSCTPRAAACPDGGYSIFS